MTCLKIGMRQKLQLHVPHCKVLLTDMGLSPWDRTWLSAVGKGTHIHPHRGALNGHCDGDTGDL